MLKPWVHIEGPWAVGIAAQRVVATGNQAVVHLSDCNPFNPDEPHSGADAPHDFFGARDEYILEAGKALGYDGTQQEDEQ
ncbi:hypothetical protein AB0C96_13015 [Streptomyces sp. NPDC048506]|uniref:hypothetical protein n=1 Tax=Streptomyces sp. NPDC048506 TaxID=3155028 RepID=UPI003419E26F